MDIREKPHQTNSRKQEPKDNQKNRKLELVRANMPQKNKIIYNINSKWQTSNVHIFMRL